MGIIIISDDFPEVLENCNRVLLMEKGHIIEHLPTKGLTEEMLSLKLTNVSEEGAA